MKKRVISAISKCLAICLIVLTLPVSALATSTTFTDVSETAYYKEPVAWAVEKGITNGTSATTFSPDNTCTRAQILTFLWRAAGSPESKNHVGKFTDVKESDYFYKAAHWAAETDIIVLKDNRFDPHTPCTRAATVEYIWRYAGAPAAEGASFKDVSPNTELETAVSWAVKNGVTNGTSATTFSPDNTCTRAQIVTFLYRAFADGDNLPEASQTGTGKDEHVNDGGESNTVEESAGFVAGKMVSGEKAEYRPAPNPNADKNTAVEELNELAFFAYGGFRFFDDGIAKNYEDEGKFAKFVTHSDGRTGINVFGWRKSYDSTPITNSCLNLVLESFYYMTGDREVAKALWDVVDYLNINGGSISNDRLESMGFSLSNETASSIEMTMNGVHIYWEWPAGTASNIFYFG